MAPSSPEKKKEAAAPQVPPPPDICQSYVRNGGLCPPSAAFEASLADALELQDAGQRDAALSCLEQGSVQQGSVQQGSPQPNRSDTAALIRALRADLAPTACADVLVSEFLASSKQKLKPDEESALLGLLVAGKLSRLSNGAPALTPPFDKPHFEDFFEHQLKPWLLAQAIAIGSLSRDGARLTGYGKAIAAVEAGLADLRFVQVARQVELPKELAADPDVKNVYYAALDEALEPRKTRGRDAALVGLRLLAELGVLADPRVQRARELLAASYGGSRIDALDRLLLPDMPALKLDTPLTRLRARLPPFYAQRLLPTNAEPLDASVLRALGERGIPAPVRAQLDAELASLPADVRRIYAALELRRGSLYFSGAAFAHAAQLAAMNAGAADAEARFIEALARALEEAPKDAVELMLGSPRLPRLGNSEPLRKLASQAGPYRAQAEFDAAYLDYLAPGTEQTARFWRELAQRFERAARRLSAGPAQKYAQDLARSAAATADSLASTPPVTHGTPKAAVP
ncbi:MAG TPA: hypothetical protein VFQ61_05635 [Polyangiaceae bacterium]|nr:hypothetical protein [Polyangiaceae bacterium]